MQQIQECVQAVQQRQQRQWLWNCSSVGLVVSSVLACLLAVIRAADWLAIPALAILTVVFIGPLVGALLSFLKPRQAREAAAVIDRTLQLKDRVATALGFLTIKGARTSVQDLQLADTQQHLQRVNAEQVVAIQPPRSWLWGLSLAFLTFLLVGFGGPADQAVAELVPDEVVLEQADTVEESLQELEEFVAEDMDEELNELLKELSDRLESLKEPGTDPREALAQLSEMETALLEKQQQLQNPDAEAQLAQIGEALSLSEDMQAAGQAMSSGQMDKAAEELAKLKMPELDRQTEKAITEKLNQVQQNDGSGKNSKLKQAAAKASSGMSQKNRGKFQEGMKGLAGECKKQGRRRKLSDLLKKQCRCLSECKGECESACRNPSNSNGKGGKNWGLGKSENTPGDRTLKLNSAQEMKLKGQESAGGDIDVETETAPETAQEAVRRYQQQQQRYEQLSESVLDSEPIPLGHRQTIRRYFEMIRPQAGEVDAVNEQAAP